MSPNGRPLFDYRLTETQLARLQDGLRAGLARGVERSLAVDFVLWAAETCRRRYQGGTLTWSFLFDLLGVRLDQATARELTREGLRRLKRPGPRHTDAGNVQYLRTLAAEGGVPVHLIGQGTWRAAIVGLVTDIERFGLACPDAHAVAFARSRSAALPLGYRNEEFWAVLVAFARELIAIRAALPAGLGPGAMEAWLDGHRPDWRDGLPVRLDEGAARALLAEAVSARSSATAEGAPVRRLLVRNSRGDWEARLTLGEGSVPAAALPEPGREVQRMRLAPAGALAAAVPQLLLAAEREEPGADWAVRRISGPRTALIAFPLGAAPGFLALAEGRAVGEAWLPGTTPLDPAEGLTVWGAAGTDEDGEVDRLEALGNGSLATRDPVAFVLVPPDGEVRLTEGLEGGPFGSVPGGGRVWRVRGEGRVSAGRWSVRVRTGSDREARDRLVALGPVSAAVAAPGGGPIYLGLPEVWRAAGAGLLRRPRPDDLRWRVPGAPAWGRRPPPDHLGAIEVAAVEGDGQFGPHLRLQVLTKGATFATRAEPGRVALRVAGLPPGVLLGLAGEVWTETDGSGQALLPVPPALADRTELPLSLRASGTERPTAWTLHLTPPCGRLVDEKGATLQTERVATLDDLRRWRAVPAGRGVTCLSLRQRSRDGERGPWVVLPLPAALPLSAVAPVIEELLALEADGTVALRVISDPDRSPRLVVRRFDIEARLDGNALRVAPADLRPSEWAQRSRPADVTAVDLHDPSRTAEIAASGERGLHDALGPGLWFIVPHLDGRVARPPRPMAVTGTTGTPGAGVSEALRAAGDAPNQDARVAAFARVLREAPHERDLDALGSLIDLLSDLNATASLDQVRALASCPVTAVRLVLRADDDRVGTRLGIEVNGGPSWILTSPEAWGEAVRIEVARIKGLVAALGERAQALAEEEVRRRLTIVLLLRPELAGQVGLGLLRSGLLGDGPLAIAGLRRWMGRVPVAFRDPERELGRLAELVVKRHAEVGTEVPDLRARVIPPRLAEFSDAMRGLVEAPLVLAEHALGLRPPPASPERAAILRYVHMDPVILQEALPAALAWRATAPARR